MTKEYKSAYEKFLKVWGENAQIMMAVEEMSELTKELCKYLRYKEWEKSKVEKVIPNIHEEIADVLNCIEQLELIFEEKEIAKIRDEKIKRTLKKVENNGKV